MYHNGEKQVMNSGEDDYRAKLKAAMAGATDNAFINGVKEVYREGAGEAIKADLGHYGAPRQMPQQILEGAYSNFQQRDNPGNQMDASAVEMLNKTADADAQTSATRSANKDPQEFQTDALDRRLAVIGGALGTTANNLNSHQDVYRA